MLPPWWGDFLFEIPADAMIKKRTAPFRRGSARGFVLLTELFDCFAGFGFVGFDCVPV
jgi:hypothetical protein